MSASKTLGIIPARYGSSRFPGKPLVEINGKPMIQRVYEQASKCPALQKVVVATDDERIKNAVENFGGNILMTSTHHNSGTERCGEVLEKLDEQFDIVINIQGDEPFLHPGQLELLVNCFSNPQTQIATLAIRLNDPELLFNPNTPKVIFDKNQEAIYFSRHPIPFVRGVDKNDWLKNHDYYKHIGIYAFRTSVLNEVNQLPVSSLEKAESLEQLRWLENGFKIQIAITENDTVTIDTPEDLERAGLSG